MYNCNSTCKGKTNQLKINLYMSLFENEYAKKYLQWANEYTTDILQIEKTVDNLREINSNKYVTKVHEYRRILNDLVKIQEFLINRALQIETKST